MAYGFGARTFLDDNGPACNLFSMSGDFMSPYVENISDNYSKTLKNVKLSLPVMYKSIIKIVFVECTHTEPVIYLCEFSLLIEDCKVCSSSFFEFTAFYKLICISEVWM